MRTIGINLHAMRGLSHADFLREIAALGVGATFTGVREAAEQAEIAALCDKFAVRCESLHAPFSHINDIWKDCEGGEAMERELLETVDHCLIAGADIAVVHLSSGLKPPPVTDLGRGRFTRVVEYAASKGVRIAFENQRFLSNIAWAFETFAPEVVGFCWDTGHEGCFTPGWRYMPLFGDRLICTHIQDNLGNFDEDLHYLPYDGKLDFGYVADAIRASGYRGTLMLEGLASNSHHYDDMTPEAYLAKAAEALRRLRAAIDEA